MNAELEIARLGEVLANKGIVRPDNYLQIQLTIHFKIDSGKVLGN